MWLAMYLEPTPMPLQSGLVPTLLATLTRHARLAQEALDTSVKRQNLVHLFGLKQKYDNLTTLAHQGHLPEAVGAAAALESELHASPEPLTRSTVMVELRVRFIPDSYLQTSLIVL